MLFRNHGAAAEPLPSEVPSLQNLPQAYDTQPRMGASKPPPPNAALAKAIRPGIKAPPASAVVPTRGPPQARVGPQSVAEPQTPVRPGVKRSAERSTQQSATAKPENEPREASFAPKTPAAITGNSQDGLDANPRQIHETKSTPKTPAGLLGTMSALPAPKTPTTITMAKERIQRTPMTPTTILDQKDPEPNQNIIIVNLIIITKTSIQLKNSIVCIYI